MKRACVWFRNDLRVDDHPALAAAAAEGEEVVAVYVWEERCEAAGAGGVPRMGPRRQRFLAEAVGALREALAARGGVLLECRGRAEEVVPAVAAACGCTAVYAHREAAWEEQEVERAVEQQVTVRWFEGRTLVHPDDLPFEIAATPRIFTAFRKKVEAEAAFRNPIPAPERVTAPANVRELAAAWVQGPRAVPEVEDDPRGVLPFRGGLVAAEARMHHYFEATRAAAHYKQTRNGLLGADYSSKFSPWLATGALGPRRVLERIRRFEAEHGATEDTYWLIFELLWRDFFAFVARQHGRRLFAAGGLGRSEGDVSRGRNDSRARAAFASWCEGYTGEPFIDANMRELTATGFMSNRGRQNVASYLVHDLGVDWRLGAAFFEHHLLDFDPASNAGNWLYIAGLGNDPRPNRRFNPARQTEFYDPDGAYRTHWLP